jgi:lipoprotein-releasing system ATP-binding protein
MPLIRLENISKAYYLGEKDRERVVLNHINLEVSKGDSIAISGPSGSGKSTLLNIMGCMDKADSGQLWYRDEDISQIKLDQLARIRNHNIGFVFQQHHLMPQLTLLENVTLPLLEEEDKKLKREGRDRAVELLEWVGLDRQKEQFPWQLSGGECQRGAVVRAMIREPELILADEPTGSLDEDNARIMVDLLLRIKEEKGIALVMVTHALDLAQKMETQYRLSHGSLMKEA